MKKSISLLTVVCMAGFGSFFANMRQVFHYEEKTTAAPPPTTAPYVRPEGLLEAPDGKGKMIALTFDDGPGGEVTDHVLSSLKKAGGRATFFCVGNRAEHYQQTLKRIVDLGCEVASHSYTHKRLTRLDASDLEQDLAKASAALEQYAGVAPKLMRPPYGSVSERMLRHTNLPVILWSIDSEDWRYCEQLCKNRSDEQRQCDYRRVVNGMLEYVQDGDILLMHDLYEFTRDVADAVIAELHHKGWQLVTVSELFAAKGIVPEAGVVYYNAR